MNLSQQKVSFEGTIKDLAGDEDYITRLRELGFVRGEKIRIRAIAPFGEPLMVEVRGTVMALRKSEAQCILL